jgi:nickel-dependent lactate racemase
LTDSISSISELGLEPDDLQRIVAESLGLVSLSLKRVLLVAPDITRLHSRAGEIACEYYRILSQTCDVDLLPALGTHSAMTKAEAATMFPSIPFEKIIHHDWRSDLVSVGAVPASWIEEHSNGFLKRSVSVELNRALLSGYDLIISIGQVVPHEVAGMANYTKNIVVGCGGKSMIDCSHMLGAAYGIEEILGTTDNPIRALFDYAQREFLRGLPLLYFLTVSVDNRLIGAFAGTARATFEEAAMLSRQRNIICVGKRLNKVVVWLDPKKFKSTWLGNKAIYRTRMTLADGADLMVLAPGVRCFGEDKRNDELIRKYGYAGRGQVLEWLKSEPDLEENLSVAAHLIHGSSDGRFNITYAVEHLEQKEIEQVNFKYADYSKIKALYPIEQWSDGIQTLANGEELYFVANPAAALWRASDFEQSLRKARSFATSGHAEEETERSN